MKIASSSASFARSIAAGELTQLEWLDICANELEVDAVVFEAAHFPRTDAEYLAQLKKLAIDLGLAIAAVAADDVIAADGERWLDVALALGAPIVVFRARGSAQDPGAWGAFADIVKSRSAAAKRANVVLAVRNAGGTLCAGVVDLKRIAKDVDSAWLRFAPDWSAFGATDPAEAVLPKAVIGMFPIANAEQFAQPADALAGTLITMLARFRACVVLEHDDALAPRDSYHRAVQRFSARRTLALEPESA